MKNQLLEGNNSKNGQTQSPIVSTVPTEDSFDYRDFESPDSICDDCGERLPESEFDYISREFVTICRECGNTYTSKI